MTTYFVEKRAAGLEPKALEAKKKLATLGTPEAFELLDLIHKRELQLLGRLQGAPAKRELVSELEKKLVASRAQVIGLSHAAAHVANAELGKVVLELEVIDQGDALRLGADVMEVLAEEKGLIGLVTALLGKFHRECEGLTERHAKARLAADMVEREARSALLSLESAVVAGRALLALSGLSLSKSRGKRKAPVARAEPLMTERVATQ